mgnify:CR=1 FL=1
MSVQKSADLRFVAIRILLHDRVRFAITAGGVAVAIMLIFMQGGMYLGFMHNASCMIDRSDADVWVVSKNSPNFDWSRPFPERYLTKVRSTPGVAQAKSLIFAWAFLRRPGGGTEQVELIGYHPSPEAGWGEPWNLVSGEPSDVQGGERMIVDESSLERLGVNGVGDRVEIMEREVKIVGLTRGIRSMTTAPFVFVSYQTAQKLASYLGERNTVFVLAKAEAGVTAEELKQRLQERLPYVDVLTKNDYSRRTRRYWTIQTGMGFGFMAMTMLALGVGLAIVGQTIYAATMEHLREYATLKALGATDAELRVILWTQAGVSAVLGFVVSLGAVWFGARWLDSMGLTIVLPPLMYPAVFALDVAMCLGASIISVRKALALDPAMVFRA